MIGGRVTGERSAGMAPVTRQGLQRWLLLCRKSLNAAVEQRGYSYDLSFFGSDHPECPKLVALKVLDYLDNKDIYSASITSTYWARASMDDALWTKPSSPISLDKPY